MPKGTQINKMSSDSDDTAEAEVWIMDAVANTMRFRDGLGNICTIGSSQGSSFSGSSSTPQRYINRFIHDYVKDWITCTVNRNAVDRPLYWPIISTAYGTGPVLIWGEKNNGGSNPTDSNAAHGTVMREAGTLVSLILNLKAAVDGFPAESPTTLTIDVLKNGVSIGSATWNANEDAVKTITANTAFVANDIIKLRATVSDAVAAGDKTFTLREIVTKITWS